MLERIKLPCTEKQCDQAWNGKSYYFDRALKKFCAKKEHQRIEKGMCNRKYRDLNNFYFLYFIGGPKEKKSKTGKSPLLSISVFPITG